MFFNWRRQNDVFIKKGVFVLAFLFLCVSCATTRTLFFDGSGAGEVRKDIGRIEGVELSIKKDGFYMLLFLFCCLGMCFILALSFL